MSHNDVTRQIAQQLQTEEEHIHHRLTRLGEILRIEANPDLDEGDFTLEEHEITLTLMHELESRLAWLERALERIEQGTYGLCERCGEPIDPARLEVRSKSTDFLLIDKRHLRGCTPSACNHVGSDMTDKIS